MRFLSPRPCVGARPHVRAPDKALVQRNGPKMATKPRSGTKYAPLRAFCPPASDICQHNAWSRQTEPPFSERPRARTRFRGQNRPPNEHARRYEEGAKPPSEPQEGVWSASTRARARFRSRLAPGRERKSGREPKRERKRASERGSKRAPKREPKLPRTSTTHGVRRSKRTPRRRPKREPERASGLVPECEPERAQARTQARVQTHAQPRTRTQQGAARKSAPTRSSKTPRSPCAPRRCRPCWTPTTASASTARPHRSR